MRRLLMFNLATDEDDPILGFAVGWVRRLAEHVGEIDVVTMREGPHDLPSNVRVHSLGKELGLGEVRRGARFYRFLMSLLARKQYDAAFAHMTPLFATMAAPLLRARRVPLTLWYARAGGVSSTLAAATRMVDLIVTPSFDSFPLRRSNVVEVGHGIDTDRFSPAAALPHASFDVITVGRVAPIKRIEVMIEAIQGIAADGCENARLTVVGPVLPGDRAYGERLVRDVAQRDLGNVVTFRAPLTQAEVVGAYRGADVVLNLSATGSLDKVVLEAMACAVPVVTSNSAFASLLTPIEPRILAHPNDAAGAADALRVIAAMTNDERGALGTRLREAVLRHHSLGRLIDELVDVLPRARKVAR